MASAAADIEVFPDDQEIEVFPDDAPAHAQIEVFPDDEPTVESEAVRNTQAALQARELMGAPIAWANQAVGEINFRQQRARELDAEANAVLDGQGEFATPQQQQIAGGYRQLALQETQAAQEIGNRLRQIAPEIQDQPNFGGAAQQENYNAAVDRTNFLGRSASQLLQAVGSDTLASQVEDLGRSPLGLNFQANIGAAAGGAAGAALMTLPGGQSLGARMMTPMIAEVAAPMGGALMGSVGGAAGQEAIQRVGETPVQTEARHEVLAETQRQAPFQSMVGQSFANAPFMRPSLSVISEAMAGNRTAQALVGSSALIGGAMGAVPAAFGHQPFSLANIAQGALENVIFNKPTRLGRALGLPDVAPVREGGLAEPPDLHFDPTEPPTTTPDAQQISQPTSPDGGVLTPEVSPQNIEVPTPQGGEGIPSSRQAAEVVEPAPEPTPTPVAETPAPTPAQEAQEAAAIAESEPTGIRNAIVDPARQQRGMAEREAIGTRTYAQLWDETKALVQQDPQAGTRLINGLKQQTRPLTDSEDALLTHEQTQREAELDAATEAVNNATPEEADAAQQRFAEAQNAVFDAYTVGQNAGTENARGLAARRLMINRDFSLAKMMSRYRAEINGGKPLSKEQQTQVVEANKRIKDLEEANAAKDEQIAVLQAQGIFNELKKTARKEATSQQRRSVVDFLAEQEAKARQRIISRRGRLNVTIDPLNIAGLVDEAIIGASKLARGVRDFAAWSKEMVSEFGERIRPQLQALFNRSGQIEAENAAILTGKEPVSTAAAESLNQKEIFDRARSLVQQGAKDLDEVIPVITKEIQAKDPSVTERQVRDMFSGYGKTTTPSKEADLTMVRELKNLARLTSQLEDATAGLAPLKTGPQRDKATARVRELQKQVEVAKRKAGITTTDPATQLAGAHQARVTRLKNAIEETQKNIADRKRTERPDPVPWTPEETALRDELEELKTRLDDVLNEPDSAQLDRLSKRIADVTEKIKNNDISAKGKVQGPPTKEVAEAQVELARLNKELAQMRKVARDRDNLKKTPDQRKEDALLKRRDELLDDIFKGNIAARHGKPTAETMRQAELRSEIAELNKRKAEMRKAATPGKPADEAQFKALEKRIADAKAALASGNLAPKTGTPSVATARVTQARAELAALNKQIADLRASSDDLRLAADKKRINTQIKTLQDRISKGDYAKPEKREAVLDDEKLQLQFKLAEEKRKWNEGFLAEKRKQRTFGQKARDVGSEILNTSRAILTSADVSAPLRQGGFIFLGNPVRGLKALPDMFRALVMGGDKAAFKVMRDIETHPDAPAAEAAGLYLARDGHDLKAMEEAYASRWLKRSELVPGETGKNILRTVKNVATGIPRGSARAYTTFLNKLRFDTFVSLKSKLSAATPAENKAIANYINAATGRGKFGVQSLENSAQALNTFFFAPRYVASRFQLLAGQPLTGGTMRTKALVAKEYAKFLGGIATVYALGKLAGGTVEEDPRSSDFGKIRFGQTRLDPLSGLAQVTTLVSRLATGQTKNLQGRIQSLTSNKYGAPTRTEVATRFLRTKLSPAIGALVDLGSGKNVVGEKVTPAEVAQRMVVPISFQDIAKHMEAQGVPKGTALFILSLFGMGLQTYDTKR